MKKIVSSEFNFDTASVEVKCADGSMTSIYCPGSAVDWLIYNDPAANTKLILNGNPETYLQTDAEYMPLD